MNFPHKAAIQSLTKVNGQSKYSNSGSTVCFLQPLDAEYAQTIGMTYTKAFACYVPNTAEIREKHRLLIDGETYGVSGVQAHNYGNLNHKRLIMERL